MTATEFGSTSPTTQYPSTLGFISNHWYGHWGQVNHDIGTCLASVHAMP
jgi:hypothetical protein